MQQSSRIVEPEKKRTNHFLFRCVTESANHAIGGSETLYFLHSSTFSTSIRKVDALGYHSIQTAAHCLEPLLRFFEVARGRRKYSRACVEILVRELFQRSSSLRQGLGMDRTAAIVHQQIEGD